MSAPSDAGLGTHVIDHAGIVVRDFDRATAAFARLLGRPVPPERGYDPDDLARRDVRFRGEPIGGGTRAATFLLDNIGLDFLEPVGGASPWREFLDRHGQGGDHVGVLVEDVERRLDGLAAEGYELMQTGRAGPSSYAYVETRDPLGTDLEVLPAGAIARDPPPPPSTGPNLLTTTRVAQIAYVVPDLDRTVAGWARALGLPAPELRDTRTDPELKDRPPGSYRGEPLAAGVGLRFAFFHLDNVDLELLEPAGGPSAWSEVLEAQGAVMHHIAFEVTDAEAVLAALEEAGYPTLQRSLRATGAPLGYADAREEIGVLLEILGAPPEAG